MARKPAAKASYHHGNLRAALLDAALAILEREGLSGLTLRKVAAKARVSHAAPAHHFPTIKALETALAAIAFERFHDAMATARRAAPADPAAQVRAAGDGYLAFARANPALFRLMFAASQLDWSDAALKDAATASFQQLTDITAPFADQLGLKSDADRAALQRLIWSNAHGFAHLYIDGKMPADAKAPDLARFLAPAGSKRP
ncbi:TetR-like C-terminal domain-containing protein [Dongia rigui]|uniref:TetR-like C-terminal domain-containing protein n=1 Tax=Dongia rigui TaxID=940149 RepID=A0ABU5DYB9_9PROT|nr:TetR-like C-terminal domain-containing protein [Dongia rigui]MDY0871698.1 TetR-like C-terminal domain-containing protein [Dongia rigui]